MSISAAVSIISVIILVAILMAVLGMTWNLQEEKKYLRQRLLTEESKTARMLNMMLSKDLPQLAGLTQIQTPSNPFASEYIPRDDVSEYRRLQAMNAHSNPGIGEMIFDHDFAENDPELNQAISELTRNGQISYEDGAM